MFKIRRSRSSVQDRVPTGQLTGMPALKQRRSSERNLQLSPDFLPPRLMPSYKHVKEEAIVEKDAAKFYRSTPDLLKTVPDCYPPTPLKAGKLNGVTNGRVERNQNAKKRESKPEKSIPPAQKQRVKVQQKNKKPAKDRKKKKVEKTIDKSRGLHSVKKQRQADRQSTVNESLRDLTPRERETIMLLEEVLKNEGTSDSESDLENGEVFTRSSSSSSFGSVIDLVSQSPSATSSLPRVCSFDDDIYAEIGDEKPAERDENFEHCELEQSSHTTDYETTNKTTAPENVEPVYSVVIKPKRNKNNNNKNTEEKQTTNHTSSTPFISNGNTPASCTFANGTSRQRSGSHASECSSIALLSPQRLKSGEEDGFSFDVIDESLRAKSSQFVVTPSKTLTQDFVLPSPTSSDLPCMKKMNNPPPSGVSSASAAFSRLSVGGCSEESQERLQSPNLFSPREENQRTRPFVINAASRSLYLE